MLQHDNNDVGGDDPTPLTDHEANNDVPPYDPFKDSALRFLGFTNELGEAFRHLVPVSVVRATYVVAGVYALGDAVDKSLKSHARHNDILDRHARLHDLDVRKVYHAPRHVLTIADEFCYTALWQALASVFLPALCVNRVCRLSRLALRPMRIHKSVKSGIVVASGLGTIPVVMDPIDWFVHKALHSTYRPVMHWMHSAVSKPLHELEVSMGTPQRGDATGPQQRAHSARRAPWCVSWWPPMEDAVAACDWRRRRARVWAHLHGLGRSPSARCLALHLSTIDSRLLSRLRPGELATHIDWSDWDASESTCCAQAPSLSALLRRFERLRAWVLTELAHAWSDAAEGTSASYRFSSRFTLLAATMQALLRMHNYHAAHAIMLGLSDPLVCQGHIGSILTSSTKSSTLVVSHVAALFDPIDAYKAYNTSIQRANEEHHPIIPSIRVFVQSNANGKVQSDGGDGDGVKGSVAKTQVSRLLLSLANTVEQGPWFELDPDPDLFAYIVDCPVLSRQQVQQTLAVTSSPPSKSPRDVAAAAAAAADRSHDPTRSRRGISRILRWRKKSNPAPTPSRKSFSYSRASVSSPSSSESACSQEAHASPPGTPSPESTSPEGRARMALPVRFRGLGRPEAVSSASPKGSDLVALVNKELQRLSATKDQMDTFAAFVGASMGPFTLEVWKLVNQVMNLSATHQRETMTSLWSDHFCEHASHCIPLSSSLRGSIRELLDTVEALTPRQAAIKWSELVAETQVEMATLLHGLLRAHHVTHSRNIEPLALMESLESPTSPSSLLPLSEYTSFHAEPTLKAKLRHIEHAQLRSRYDDFCRKAHALPALRVWTGLEALLFPSTLSATPDSPDASEGPESIAERIAHLLAQNATGTDPAHLLSSDAVLRLQSVVSTSSCDTSELREAVRAAVHDLEAPLTQLAHAFVARGAQRPRAGDVQLSPSRGNSPRISPVSRMRSTPVSPNISPRSSSSRRQSLRVSADSLSFASITSPRRMRDLSWLTSPRRGAPKSGGMHVSPPTSEARASPSSVAAPVRPSKLHASASALPVSASRTRLMAKGRSPISTISRQELKMEKALRAFVKKWEGGHESPYRLRVQVIDAFTGHLEQHGMLGTEGLYRRAGPFDAVKRLWASICLGHDPLSHGSTEWREHTVACALKRYIYEAKEPMIPMAAYDHLAPVAQSYCAGELNAAAAVEQVKTITRALVPATHVAGLRRLCYHLAHVAENCDNRMSSASLAMVFGPILMRPKVETIVTLMGRDQATVIQLMIDHVGIMFPPRSIGIKWAADLILPSPIGVVDLYVQPGATIGGVCTPDAEAWEHHATRVFACACALKYAKVCIREERPPPSLACTAPSSAIVTNGVPLMAPFACSDEAAWRPVLAVNGEAMAWGFMPVVEAMLDMYSTQTQLQWPVAAHVRAQARSLAAAAVCGADVVRKGRGQAMQWLVQLVQAFRTHSIATPHPGLMGPVGPVDCALAPLVAWLRDGADADTQEDPVEAPDGLVCAYVDYVWSLWEAGMQWTPQTTDKGLKPFQESSEDTSSMAISTDRRGLGAGARLRGSYEDDSAAEVELDDGHVGDGDGEDEGEDVEEETSQDPSDCSVSK